MDRNHGNPERVPIPSRDGAPPARARAKRAGRAGWAVRPEGPAGSPRDYSHGNPQRVPKPSRDGTPPAKPAGSPRDLHGNPQRVRFALRPPTRHPHPARFPLRGLRDLHLPHHTRSLRSRPRARPRAMVRRRRGRARSARGGQGGLSVPKGRRAPHARKEGFGPGFGTLSFRPLWPLCALWWNSGLRSWPSNPTRIVERGRPRAGGRYGRLISS